MTLPGFKELGSITPSDMALEFGHKELADMILEKVKEDKGNKKCDNDCSPVTTGSPTLKSCYYPDLMEGENVYTFYFQRTNSWHNFTLKVEKRTEFL